jgi:SpoVK/Ycf46/Vps4 family AAA+-type ATPase
MPLNGKLIRNARDIATIRIYSNVIESIYNTIVEKVKGIAKKQREESNNVSLVIASRNGYDTQSFELPKQQMNIELNYGKDFTKVHEKILTTLNKKKGKGLVLLHGTPGTGKTHYLKYLASKIKGKRVLFIPPHLADFITSPEMTPFLIQNANSILFIEDAERVITDRNTGGSVGVSNILNLTDGILSDILNIQIVATFNMDKRKIDEALLRKGRLIAEHEFGKLSIEDSNSVLNHLKIPYEATKPMTLTEIYNVNEAEYKSEEKGKSTIGFR